MRQLTIALGIYSILVTLLFIDYFNIKSQELRVDDCVRELGDYNIQRVTYVTRNGSVETKTFFDNKPDRYFLTGYDSVGKTKLIKVDCETGENK